MVLICWAEWVPSNGVVRGDSVYFITRWNMKGRLIFVNEAMDTTQRIIAQYHSCARPLSLDSDCAVFLIKSYQSAIRERSRTELIRRTQASVDSHVLLMTHRRVYMYW